MVQVYGKPHCVQCDYTKKRLDDSNVPYEYHDITADEQARQIVENSGKNQLPLVVAGEESWHGLSPDRIKRLALASA